MKKKRFRVEPMVGSLKQQLAVSEARLARQLENSTHEKNWPGADPALSGYLETAC